MKITHKRQLKKLTDKMDLLDTQRKTELTVLEARYGFSDSFWRTFDWKNMYSDEKACDYFSELEEIFAKYEKEQNILSARHAALFLIATHTARKNHILHGDTATKKLKKHAETGEKVIAQIENSCYLPMFVNGHAYLHSALYKRYGVKLLDENYARYLMSQIKHLEQYIAETNDKSLQKRLDKYKKELNMFHKSIRDKITSKNTEREFAF